MSEKDGSLSTTADVASLSGEERLKYDRARKYYRDSQMFISQAYNEGYTEGFNEGYTEGYNKGYTEGYNKGYIIGIKKGESEVNALFIGRFKANGLSVEDIVKLTNMSPEEVSRYYYA